MIDNNLKNRNSLLQEVAADINNAFPGSSNTSSGIDVATGASDGVKKTFVTYSGAAQKSFKKKLQEEQKGTTIVSLKSPCKPGNFFSEKATAG